MYYSNQTLRHKETNQLVALCPTNKDTVWKWNIGNKTLFVDKQGNKFVDDISNYIHIEDELGNPCSNDPKKGQFVDESLEKYLVSKHKLLKMKKQTLNLYLNQILEKLTKEKSFMVNFSSTHNYVFKKYFLRYMHATPLYISYDKIYKKYRPSREKVFIYNHKLWLYHDNYISRMKGG